MPEPLGADVEASLTLRQACRRLYRRYGLPPDGGAARSRWAPLKRFGFYLPNFQWRRRALPVHDIHHVLTGYEFSALGEFEMSAWEFAAGRYPNAWSTLFCLPLVCMGAVAIPRRTYAAFVRGRRSKTLYRERHLETIVDRPLSEVRARYLPRGAIRATARDLSAFALLVAKSAIVLTAPVALSALLILGR